MEAKNKNFLYFQTVGLGVCALLGSLLHFTYEWSGENKFVALFSAINESTWEHMKLLFFPTFLFAILERQFFKDKKDFWCIKLKGISLGLVAIPVLFYTYNGAITKSPDFINILMFFIALLISFIYETKLFKKDTQKSKNPKLAFIILCLIGVTFFVLTFITPPLGIFKNPLE